jgi:2-succinyl-6-hydroxy-2,4-cyclohexadiene-1-carboxylate synthase
MPTVRANGIDIWYDLLGSSAGGGSTSGGGPTLVLNHGWLGPTDEWPPGVVERLAEQLRVLVYDVRGHGRTTAPEDPDAYSLPIYAQDLRALLDALDIERAHIGGSSQGGMIAAQFVADYPERARSLLLCDSSAGNGLDEGPGGQWERTMRSAFEQMEEIARERGRQELAELRIEADRKRDPHYFDYPEPIQERERKDRERHTRIPLPVFIGTNRAIRNRPDLTARTRELRLPALVLVGEWDDFRPCAERDHALIEGSRFVLVRRSGHGTPSWRPDAFVRAVTEFIADVEAGREVAGELEL